MKRISIVVPVYNVEKYLTQCIDSIIKQTYTDYEVVLVNDGSKDSSGKICDEYSKKYDNIKVIHKENGGLSSARNAGIQEATGEYVMFVDSDDYIYKTDCLEKLVEVINSSSGVIDLLQYKMVHYFENSDKYIKLKDYNINNELSTTEKLEQMIADGTFSPSACDKLIKLSVIKDNNVYFEKGLLSEDIKWSLNLFLHINNLAVVNESIYVYRQQRKGSITNTVSRKSIESIYSIINYWTNYKFDDSTKKELYLSYLGYQYTILITLVNKKNSDKELRDKIKKFKWLLKYDNNFKVKLCNKALKIFGLTLGVKVLKTYNYIKNKGIFKIK